MAGIIVGLALGVRATALAWWHGRRLTADSLCELCEHGDEAVVLRILTARPADDVVNLTWGNNALHQASRRGAAGIVGALLAAVPEGNTRARYLKRTSGPEQVEARKEGGREGRKEGRKEGRMKKEHAEGVSVCRLLISVSFSFLSLSLSISISFSFFFLLFFCLSFFIIIYFQFTALHACAAHGHVECTRLLVDAGIDLDAKDAAGHTALMMASCNGHDQGNAGCITSSSASFFSFAIPCSSFFFR